MDVLSQGGLNVLIVVQGFYYYYYLTIINYCMLCTVSYVSYMLLSTLQSELYHKVQTHLNCT